MKLFKTPLDQVCSKEKMKTPFHYIYFKKGFIYVTNGYVAIKQPIELHGINSKTSEILDGFAMHKDVFKLLNKMGDVEFKYLMLINVPQIGSLMAEFEIAGSKFMCNLLRHDEIFGKGKIIKQIDKAFSTFKMKSTKEVAMNPAYVDLVRRVFIEPEGMTFRFNESTGGILLTPNKNNYKEHAIIMPLIVTGEMNKK